MKKLLVSLSTLLLMTAKVYATGLFCSVVITDRKTGVTESIIKNLEFSENLFEERQKLIVDSEFEVIVHASGGEFSGLGIIDKVKDVTVGVRGLDVSYVSGSKVLRTQCIN